VQRFLFKIDGPSFRSLGEIELPRLPREGDALETWLGSRVVTAVRRLPELDSYAGTIVCRLRRSGRPGAP
jgi:hypothetical protein